MAAFSIGAFCASEHFGRFAPHLPPKFESDYYRWLQTASEPPYGPRILTPTDELQIRQFLGASTILPSVLPTLWLSDVR